jgi:LPXTG-motif cell wall-anchored protein
MFLNTLRTIKSKIALFLAIVFIASSFAVSSHALAAVEFTTSRECNSNAVLYCGALNTSDVEKKYSNAGVAEIYDYFGISKADVLALKTTAVAGRVYKNGEVTVNGKVVATNAVTAGRNDKTGSTKVTHKGVTFYKRAPSVSFKVDYISSFVVLKDGQFDFAIIASCGNPVFAKPIPTPTPTTPTVTPTTTPTTTPNETPKELPNTGTSTYLSVFMGVSALASLAYYIFKRQ